jgi:hypothetical protein
MFITQDVELQHILVLSRPAKTRLHNNSCYNAQQWINFTIIRSPDY